MNRVNVGGPLRAARCLYVPYMCDDVSAGVRQRRVIIRTSGSAPSRVAGGCSALRRGDLRGRGAATWRGILNRCQHVQRAASSRSGRVCGEYRGALGLWSKNAGASPGETTANWQFELAPGQGGAAADGPAPRLRRSSYRDPRGPESSGGTRAARPRAGRS